MAIYTQYARYLKAREFKRMIEDQGDTYMLLGLGNPFWDAWDGESSSAAYKMPIAPYDTAIMTNGTSETNQFYDTNAYQHFIYKPKDGSSILNIDTTMIDSIPQSDYNIAVKNLLPTFPCDWKGVNSIIFSTNESTPTQISLSDYYKYFIDPATKKLCHRGDDGTIIEGVVVDLPVGTSANDIIYRQAYAEMYLRGIALSGSTKGIRHPVGLLGAVRCNINFVKDIGSNDSVYTGDVKQIWYGDRYWEILDKDPLDDNDSLEKYIRVTAAEQASTSTSVKETILPHHLLFNATINPMKLCSELKIDQNIVPRQIAIFVRKRQPGNVIGPNYYPVNDNTVFNFGQYNWKEIYTYDEESSEDPKPIIRHYDNVDEGVELLNFTLPVKVGTGENEYRSPGEESDPEIFKYILSDHIKGSVRDKHSIDRIGYVLGF